MSRDNEPQADSEQGIIGENEQEDNKRKKERATLAVLTYEIALYTFDRDIV